MSEEKKPVNIQDMAGTLKEMLNAVIDNAQRPDVATPFKTEKQQADRYTKLISKPTDTVKQLETEVFVTGTLLDKLFLKHDDERLNGVPMVGQIGIVGLPDSGKSILVQEIALRVASGGQKVVFVTSEDMWDSPTPRFDLQSRMKEKASIMGLSWENIKQHLYVFDTIAHSEFRDWNTFVDAYRSLVEAEQGIDLLIIDSITLMESYRGALKDRVRSISEYNQIHGVTAFYVCQRSAEDVNKYAMAGGIGLAHNLDITICLDHGKVWGSQMKLDLNLNRDKAEQLKQGAWVNFIRVMGCRLCNFHRLHFEIEITKQGLVRAKQ